MNIHTLLNITKLFRKLTLILRKNLAKPKRLKSRQMPFPRKQQTTKTKCWAIDCLSVVFSDLIVVVSHSFLLFTGITNVFIYSCISLGHYSLQ